MERPMSARTPPPGQLAPLIARAEAAGHSDDPLRQAFVREVDTATRRLPDCWFELGRRSPDAVESLAHRVLVRCARAPLGRYPFSGRTLFRSAVEEQWGDPPVRYHAFRSKLSVTRELLRSDRAFNLARDPVSRAADARYRALSAAMRRVGVPVSVPAHQTPMWQAPGDRPRLARAPDQVVARLMAHRSTLLPADLDPNDPAPGALDALVLRFLEEVGQPVGAAALASALGPVLGALPGPPPRPEQLPEPSVDAGDPLTRSAVRQAVLGAWAALGPDERALLRGVAEGEDADALMRRAPRLNNRVAVTRAITRINTHFLGAVATAIGGEASPEAAPRALLELVLEVLLAVLPEVSDV
jgi:hypothetical protein